MRRAWQRRRGPLFGVLLASIAALAAPTRMLAQDPGVRIGLTYEAGVKPGVMVLPVRGLGGDSIRVMLQRDLENGDRVEIIAGDGPPPLTVNGRSQALNYGLYGTLRVAAVVEAVITATGLRVLVHDVALKKVADTREGPLPTPLLSEAWRQAVHRIADDVEQSITGVRGVAATRVLFVKDRRIWRIDSDGANPTPVSEAGALSPAWHPGGRQFTYSQFAAEGTRLVTQEFGGAAKPVAGTGRGLHITPTWSPDGATLVWASGDGDGTDLVARTVGDATTVPVTVGRGTDNVSPTFAPDGRRLAFTSGRSGHPEVYISDADGTNAELLTAFAFGDRAYRSNPSWSPDGRAVAFQSQLEGRFQIVTITLRDRTTKQHTSDGENEDPSWAPDGRHLVFTSTRSGSRELWVLDTESGRLRQLTRGGGARMAAWGPRI
jgi:TolB protein